MSTITTTLVHTVKPKIDPSSINWRKTFPAVNVGQNVVILVRTDMFNVTTNNLPSSWTWAHLP